MRNMFNYLPFYFVTPFILGIFLQHKFGIWTHSITTLFLILTFLLLLLFLSHQWRKKHLFWCIFPLLFLGIGITSVYINHLKNAPNYFEKHLQDAMVLQVQIEQKLKENNRYHRYITSIKKINQQAVVGKLLLAIEKDSSQAFHIGQQIYLSESPVPIRSNLNPYQFDYSTYLARQNIFHQITTNSARVYKEKYVTFSIYSLAEEIRETIQEALQKYPFSEDTYSILNALLLGERKEVSKTLISNYVNAGAIHILALSGLHIGILVFLLNKLLYPLRKIKYGKAYTTIFLLCFLWFFACIAGLSASITRAVTMFSFLTIANHYQRHVSIEHTLISSMFFLLLLQPMFLFDVGFQLSYAAVFSIVWLEPLLSSVYQPKITVITFFWKILTVSTAAQLGILPISLYYFHQFPALFFLSNLCILPFLSVLLGTGFLFIILALLDVLPNFLVTSYDYAISVMNSSITWISNQENFLFKNIPFDVIDLLFTYAIFLALYQLLQHFTFRKCVLFLSIIILTQVHFLYATRQKHKVHEFVIFHQTKTTLLAQTDGIKTAIYSNAENTEMIVKTIQGYRIKRNTTISFSDSIPTYFKFGSHRIVVIDNETIYPIDAVKNSIILLRNSPKIHLDKLLKMMQPTLIIADGSNYKSYIERWKQTCLHKKTPFHNTSEHGAYLIKR